MSFVDPVLQIPRRVAQGLIVVYQKTISLDHGPFSKHRTHQVCRFHPTCSEFGYEAIGRFGVVKGGWLTTKRLCRCHPWNAGGNDPVPET